MGNGMIPTGLSDPTFGETSTPSPPCGDGVLFLPCSSSHRQTSNSALPHGDDSLGPEASIDHYWSSDHQTLMEKLPLRAERLASRTRTSTSWGAPIAKASSGKMTTSSVCGSRNVLKGMTLAKNSVQEKRATSYHPAGRRRVARKRRADNGFGPCEISPPCPFRRSHQRNVRLRRAGNCRTWRWRYHA